MSTQSLLSAFTAALLCAAVPALGQQKLVNLPDGPGKEQVQSLCSGCHGLNRVMNSGYPQAYWNTAIRMMLNFGVPIPPDQINLVTDYLAKHRPEKPKPDANIINGPVKVAIREWQVPIPGSRPHDPLATRDGAIWYTGQMSNRLGRVDTKTGQVREYPLKSPLTAPHGLVEDKDGNIWFTGNQIAIVGKLDPESGNVTEWQSPGGSKSAPYGIVYTKGAVWYSESGTRPNTIVRFDPKSEQFQTWAIPSGGYIVRKMDVTPDGNPVTATSTINGVGLVEVK